MKTSISAIMLAAFVAVLAGCAGMGKGPSDEELIQSTLSNWKTSLIAKDVTKMLTSYSENFSDSEGRGKAEVGEFIQGAIDSGYLDSLEVDVESAIVTINGENATVAPIDLSSAAGSITLSLSLKKEAGNWLIVGSSQA